MPPPHIACGRAAQAAHTQPSALAVPQPQLAAQHPVSSSRPCGLPGSISPRPMLVHRLGRGGIVRASAAGPRGPTDPPGSQSSPAPQRPPGGPPASTREDLVLQRLRRAASMKETLDIVGKMGGAVGRGGAAAAAGGGAVLLTEVLKALARVAAAPQGTAAATASDGSAHSPRTGAPRMSSADVAELQALLPGLLRDLDQRLPAFPSFRLLADVTTSLGAVLEAAKAGKAQQQGAGGGGRGPAGGGLRPVAAVLPGLVCRLAPALATAARNELTSPVQQPPLTLTRLAEALLPMQQLLDLYGSSVHQGHPQAASGFGGGPTAGAVGVTAARETLRELVGWAVVTGPGRLEALRSRKTSMEELATAVQLMAVYRVRQSAEYVSAVMGRVDELVAAATPPFHQGAVGGGSSQQPRPNVELKGGQAPEAGAGGVKPVEQQEQQQQQTDQGRRNPKGRRAAREAAAAVAVQGPAELDVQSLAALLARWCTAPPWQAEPSLPHMQLQQQQSDGANAPGGHGVAVAPLGTGHRHAHGLDDGSVAVWTKWTAGKVELVWLTQHRSTQARRAAVVAELQALREQTESEAAPSPLPLSLGVTDTRESSEHGQRRSKAKSGRNGQRGTQGRGKGQAQNNPAAPRISVVTTAAATGLSTSRDKIAAATTATAAEVRRLSAELESLGPIPQTPSVPLSTLVELAVRSARLLGGACGAGGLAEEVLLGGESAPEDKGSGSAALTPIMAHAVLVAFSNMGHRPKAQSVSTAVKALLPALPQLPAPAAAELLPALLHATSSSPATNPWTPRSPTPQEVLVPLGRRVAVLADRDDERGEVVTALVVGLVRLSAAWGVPLEQEEVLVPLARVVERRMRGELPADAELLRSDDFKAFVARTAGSWASSGSRATAAPQQASPRAPPPRRMLDELVDGVLLPLAQLGQAFPTSEAFTIALMHWRAGGFPGLDARKVAALLGAAAANKGWAFTPTLRRDTDVMLAACLSEEALPRLCSSARDLSLLLLEGARVMRLMVRGGKVLAEPGAEASIAATASPQSAPLLLPAVEWLLMLAPDADALAAVAQALFVELELPLGTELPEDSERQAAADDGVSLSSHRRAPEASDHGDRQLLPQLLQLAGPFLGPSGAGAGRPQRQGCSVQGCAWLLAACVSCGHLPRTTWLTDLYGTAARQLQAKAGEAPADVLVSLIDSVDWMEKEARKGRTGGPNAEAGLTSAARALLVRHRQELLACVADRLLRGGALSSLRTQPNVLVGTVQRLAVLGVQPGPAWVAQYAELLQDDLMLPVKGRHGGLSAQGLAQGAEALALLGGAPRASWIDLLLTTAEGKTLARGQPDWRMYDPHSLGLLLGAVHVLRGGAVRTAAEGADAIKNSRSGSSKASSGRSDSAPLSTAAQQALSRAYSAFTSSSVGVMPKYTPRQLYMVVGAIVSHTLERSGDPEGATPGAGKRSLARGGFQSVMRRVEAPWLEQSCLAMQRCLAEARSAGAAEPALALPPPALVLDMMRLASQTLCSSGSGVAGISGDLGPLAQRAPALAAAAVAGGGVVSGGSGGGDSVLAAAQAAEALLEWVQGVLHQYAAMGDERVAVADWFELLTAALTVGGRAPSAALEAYCAALFPLLSSAAAAAASAGAQEADQSTSETDAQARRQRAFWEAVEAALGNVLMPALPWAPGEKLAAALREGVLLRAPLQAASMTQLALLCTYCTQAGAGSPEVWAQVALELQRRVGVWAAVSHGAGAPGKDASARQELQGSSAAVGSGHGDSFADLAAVCYALHLGGAPRLDEVLTACLQPGADRESPQALPAGWAAAAMGRWEHLSALHHLWLSHSFGSVAHVSDAAWRAAMAVPEPGSAAGLDRLETLTRRQCAQLVLLLGEAPADKREALRGHQGPQATHWEELCSMLLRRLYGSGSPDAPGGSAIEEEGPAVATAAVLHCLPEDRAQKVPPELVAAALEVLASPLLPLRAANNMLLALEGRAAAGFALGPQQVRTQVGALLQQHALEELQERQWQWQRQQNRHDGNGGDLVDRMVERRSVLANCITSMVSLLPPGQPVAEAVGPLLSALVPQADERALQLEQLDARSFCQEWDRNVQDLQTRLRFNSLFVAITPVEGPEGDYKAAVQPAPGCPAPVPPADKWSAAAAKLVTVLLSAAGPRQPLPQPAAAVVVWLLGHCKVVQKVPAALLRQALAGCLQTRPEVLAARAGGGRASTSSAGEDVPQPALPLPDTTVVLLAHRVQPAGMDVHSGYNLWACGARPEWLMQGLRAALVAARDAQEVERALAGFDVVATELILAQLVDTWDNDTEFWKEHESNCDVATRQLLLNAWVALPTDLPSAVSALEHVAWLSLRTQQEGWQGYEMLYRVQQSAGKGDRRSLRGSGGMGHSRIVCTSADDAWRLLESAFILGPRGVNNYLATVLRYAHHTQEPPKDGARISQRLESFLEETRQYVAGKLATIVRRTTYMLTEEEAYGVAQPLLRQLEVDLREVVVELQARGSKPEELLASTGLHCSYTPALSPRRVGLLYGLLAFPPFPEPDPAEARANAEAAAGVWDGEWEGSVKRFSAEWYERLEIRVGLVYVAAVEALTSRASTLEPLAHLTAVLDAVEPLLIANVCMRAVPGDYHQRPAVRAAHQALHAAMGRVLRMDGPALPEGLLPTSDCNFICSQSRTKRPQIVRQLERRGLDGWVPGNLDAVPLPSALERRYGWSQGDSSDPERGAAREAYLDEVLPWYDALRRLETLLIALRVGPAARKGVALEPGDSIEYEPVWKGVGEPSTGRWAQACWGSLGGPGRRDEAYVDIILSRIQCRSKAELLFPWPWQRLFPAVRIERRSG